MKKILSSLLCLSMLVALTACGGSERDTTYLRAAQGGDIEIMDPAIVDDSVTANVLAQMYEGLYKLDKDGNATPNVATDMPAVSEDGLTYTITINEGYKWSDGEDLTADDFIYAWKRAAAMGTADAYYSQFINKIVNGGTGERLASIDDLGEFGAVALDDYTIQITLSAKCAYFTSLLTNTVFYPVRQDAVEQYCDDLESTWANEVETPTNGAFRATKIDSKDEVVLTKNEEYHAADEVSLETISFKVMADAGSQTSAFQSGEIDWASSINLDTVNADETLKECLYAIDPFVCNYYVLFNAGAENNEGDSWNDALLDVEIREAISLAIDREAVLQVSGKGDYAYALNNLVPVGIPGANGDYTTENGNDYSGGYDLARAQEIMASKGYSEDNMLTLTYSYNDNPMHKDVAQSLQESLKKAYIDLKADQAELQTFFDNRDKGQFELARHAMTADFLDPMAYLSMYYGSNTAGNTVDDPTFEAMIDEAEALDGAERYAKLAEAEKYLVSDMHYVIPLFGYTDPFLKASDLEGITSSPEGHYDLTRAHFTTGE